MNRHRSKHLVRNNPWEELRPIRRPKTIYSSPARYAHVKISIREQLPMLQPTNARSTPGRATVLLTNTGDRSKRHATRIDSVSATSAVTFTPTSAGTRVGAIERPPEIISPHRNGLGGEPYARYLATPSTPPAESSNQSEQSLRNRLLPWGI